MSCLLSLHYKRGLGNYTCNTPCHSLLLEVFSHKNMLQASICCIKGVLISFPATFWPYLMQSKKIIIKLLYNFFIKEDNREKFISIFLANLASLCNNFVLSNWEEKSKKHMNSQMEFSTISPWERWKGGRRREKKEKKRK